MRTVIAVDAMGGDHAPAAVVEGVVQAVQRSDVGVVLVGPDTVLNSELARLGEPAGARVSVVDAADAVAMSDLPRSALRRGPRPSIRVATELVASGQASAVFSAGHSGATVLVARSVLGTLPGVDRPALAVTVPTKTGAAVLLDAGANLECRPEHLVQFAAMGAAYATVALLVERPRVGLLSTGLEAGKGTDLVREAHGLMGGSGLNFIGNLEAHELFSGRSDVVVCDGFTGNIALKVGEGLVEVVEQMLRAESGGALVSQIGALLTRRAFQRLRQRVDYAEHGAALLLGVAGVTLVGHGRSPARAVASGVGLAAKLAQGQVVERLRDALAARA